MRIKAFVLCILLILPAASAGQEGFAYKRKIQGGKAGWARLVFPDDIYGNLRDDLADVRIFGVSAGGKMTEAAYLPDDNAAIITNDVDFRIINQTTTPEGRFYTFETDREEYVNRINLRFGVDNFEWRVSLEGSNDGVNWEKILSGYRIVGIRNSLTDFRFTTLEFPDARFSRFRLFIPTNSDPGPVSASIQMVKTPNRELVEFPTAGFEIREDRKAKRTVLEFALEHRIPVSAVRVRVSDTIDFQRDAVVSFADRSRGTERWVRLGSITLSSFERGPLRFEETIADRFRISVENGDNPPLKLVSVEPLGYRRSLRVRLPEAEEYWIHYSDPDAAKPVYDIGEFAETIPDDLPLLTVESELRAQASSGDALLQSRLWMWIALGIIVTLLGWFSYRLLRKVS